MTPEEELAIYKDIVKSCFTLHTNLNDTFYWACADVGEVQADDVPKLVPVYHKYGSDTLVAYEAIVRGHDPESSLMSRWKDKGDAYWKAKAELQPLADKGEILWERWANLKDKIQERAEFDGQEITWNSSKLNKEVRVYRFKNLLNNPGSGVVVMQVATLPDGTFAIGRSISEARERLSKKYKRLRVGKN